MIFGDLVISVFGDGKEVWVINWWIKKVIVEVDCVMSGILIFYIFWYGLIVSEV